MPIHCIGTYNSIDFIHRSVKLISWLRVNQIKTTDLLSMSSVGLSCTGLDACLPCPRTLRNGRVFFFLVVVVVAYFFFQNFVLKCFGGLAHLKKSPSFIKLEKDGFWKHCGKKKEVLVISISSSTTIFFFCANEDELSMSSSPTILCVCMLTRTNLYSLAIFFSYKCF